MRRPRADSLCYGPDWAPRESFGADVEAFSAQPARVTEWQYSAVRTLLADRADLLVWLDLPRAGIMRQVATRRVLRHGTHAKSAQRVAALHQERSGFAIVRLLSWREVQEWMDGRPPAPRRRGRELTP